MKPEQENELVCDDLVARLQLLVLSGRMTKNTQSNEKDVNQISASATLKEKSMKNVCIEVWLHYNEQFIEQEAFTEEHRGYLLLEQWHIDVRCDSTESGFHCTESMLVQAIKSKLYFSQLSAWLNLTQGEFPKFIYLRFCCHDNETPLQRFPKPPEYHQFPKVFADFSKSIHVSLHSLPRIDIFNEYPVFAWPVSATETPQASRRKQETPQMGQGQAKRGAMDSGIMQVIRKLDYATSTERPMRPQSNSVSSKVTTPHQTCALGNNHPDIDNLYNVGKCSNESVLNDHLGDYSRIESGYEFLMNSEITCGHAGTNSQFLQLADSVKDNEFGNPGLKEYPWFGTESVRTRTSEEYLGAAFEEYDALKCSKQLKMKERTKCLHSCVFHSEFIKGRNSDDKCDTNCDILELRDTKSHTCSPTTSGTGKTFSHTCCSSTSEKTITHESCTAGQLQLERESQEPTLHVRNNCKDCPNWRQKSFCGWRVAKEMAKSESDLFKLSEMCDSNLWQKERSKKAEKSECDEMLGCFSSLKNSEILRAVRNDDRNLLPGNFECERKISEKLLKCSPPGRKYSGNEEMNATIFKKSTEVPRMRKGDSFHCGQRSNELRHASSRYHTRHASTGTFPVFHPRTGLPISSSPAPLRKTAGVDIVDDTYGSFDLHNLSTVLSKSAPTLTSQGLLGNFEECVLNDRLLPNGVVEGFATELSASSSTKYLAHVTLPVQAYFFKLSDDNAPSPYMGYISLNVPELSRKGYHVPRKGTIQLTLFNPNQTVVKVFFVLYDFSDMKPNCQTFLRQKITSFGKSENVGTGNHDNLHYLIHLRFVSSRSGRIYLHTDIRLIFCRHPPDSGYMKTTTSGPTNPKYVPRATEVQ